MPLLLDDAHTADKADSLIQKNRTSALADLLTGVGLGYLRDEKSHTRSRRQQTKQFVLLLTIPIVVVVAQTAVMIGDASRRRRLVDKLRLEQETYKDRRQVIKGLHGNRSLVVEGRPTQ